MNSSEQYPVCTMYKVQSMYIVKRVHSTIWTSCLGIRIYRVVQIITYIYLIESISQCLHVKTMLGSRCVSFYEPIEASSRFLSNLCKNALNTVLGRNLFSIANDYSVNLSDLSKMLVKKQMKYFDVLLDHVWKVPL